MCDTIDLREMDEGLALERVIKGNQLIFEDGIAHTVKEVDLEENMLTTEKSFPVRGDYTGVNTVRFKIGDGMIDQTSKGEVTDGYLVSD